MNEGKRIRRRDWPVEIDLTPETLIEFVDLRGNVSFVEIEDYFGEQTKGDSIFGVGKLVIWANMSDRLVDVLNDERVRDTLMLDAAHWLVYANDGRMLGLPIVKEGTVRRTMAGKTPQRYWGPTILRKRTPDEVRV